MDKVSKRLGLQGAEGVETIEALTDSMVKRQVFVCIEFKIEDKVSLVQFVEPIHKRNKNAVHFH